MAKKSIVILGAGFGGLRAAMDIARGLKHLKFLDKYEIILIDRNDCHVYIPLLYKVAASPDPHFDARCAYKIAGLVKRLPIQFLQTEVVSLDLANGDIHMKNGNVLRADYLVIALGSETNFFGIAGMQEHALQLKTLETATAIRAAVEKAFSKGGDVKIIAGGAGPNGIELASEIRGWADRAEEANPALKVSVSIVEALPTILNGLDQRVAKIAAKRLGKLNIAVTLNAKITSVAERSLTIDDGKGGATTLPFDVFVWTGGVRTPAILTELPIAKDQRGRPLAKGNMVCPAGTPDLKLAPMIYGIGDSVCFMNPKTGRPTPAVAHVAILEGRIAARNLIEEIKHAEYPSHSPSTESYLPGDYPYVIPIGEGWAVAKFGPFILRGWFGWAFERLIELNYLRTIMPLRAAWRSWRKT
jgi:NADH dehydrogenase